MQMRENIYRSCLQMIKSFCSRLLIEVINSTLPCQQELYREGEYFQNWMGWGGI